MALKQAPMVTGVVQSIQVFGSGPNSAEIVVVIQVQGVNEAFRVGAYPATEPSVFSSFVSLLTGAYLTKTKVDVLYMPVQNATPQITGLVCPSATP